MCAEVIDGDLERPVVVTLNLNPRTAKGKLRSMNHTGQNMKFVMHEVIEFMDYICT